MQLKTSSPVAMEKRMDLASLFCMIGRHGPAVAVAVIAMVSVLAGFIIYRNVKGKRRKAAAGAADGDSGSPGMLTDAALVQPEGSRSRVESTDASDELSVKADADATPSLKIRNRRAPAEKKPRKYSEPDDKWLESLVQDSYSVQSNTSTAENVDVERHVCQDVMEDAKEDHDGCLTPAVICEGYEEKVLKPEGDEKVTTEDVLGQSLEENLQFVSDSPASEQNTSQMQDVQEDEEIAPETTCTGSYSEEPVHTDANIEDNHHPHHTDVSKDSNNFQEKEMKNEGHEEHIDDKLAGLQEEVGLSLFKQTSLPFSQQDDGENMKDEMPSVQDGAGQQESENDPTCDQEGGVEKEMLPSSCDEVQYLQSVVLNHALPLLNQSVDPDMISDALCDPTADTRDLQPKDDMIPELAEDAVVGGLCPDVPELKNIQDESDEAATAVMPSEESMEHLVLSVGDPDAAVSEKASLTSAVTSTEMPPPEVFSCQDQKSDQMQDVDLPELTSAPAPDMTEGIKPPVCQIPLSFDQIELTWSSSGAGEESGISSMTVSPALQDADIECDITSENVTHLIMDRCPGSEEQTGVQIQFFADDEAVAVKDMADTFPGSLLHLSQKCDGEETKEDKSSTGNGGMFGQEDVYHGAPSQSAVQVSELKKETDAKTEVKENEKKDDEKTEINIMAATMDNNEWITDGNYQVLPWMNLSVPPLTQNTQTDPCSAKEDHSLLPVDSSRNAANPPSTEAGQSILPYDNIENDKKIVAVQPMPQNVTVTFRTHYLTHSPYQKVAITGNQQELGNWKEFIPLERAKDGHWATVVSLPAESHVEWKFVVLDKGEVCRWEECGNRLLDTGYGDDLLVHKWWGIL